MAEPLTVIVAGPPNPPEGIVPEYVAVVPAKVGLETVPLPLTLLITGVIYPEAAITEAETLNGLPAVPDIVPDTVPDKANPVAEPKTKV